MWNQHDMMPYHWGWGLLMGIFWLIVVAGLVVGFTWLVREYIGRELAGGAERRPSDDLESPREFLDRLYAEGEITCEEYEAMKRDLEQWEKSSVADGE